MVFKIYNYVFLISSSKASTQYIHAKKGNLGSLKKNVQITCKSASLTTLKIFVCDFVTENNCEADFNTNKRNSKLLGMGVLETDNSVNNNY